jgi:sec-independent protein translocase protein TatA
MQSAVLAQLLGPDAFIIIGVVLVVLLFGGSKLPKLARSLGGASHEFKKGIESGDSDESPSALSASPVLARREER